MADPEQLELDFGAPCTKPLTKDCAWMHPNVNEIQIGGSHYKQLEPQPWDVISAWNMGFLDGNVVKYVARFRNKGGLQDLHKARHYLQKLIEDEESKL